MRRVSREDRRKQRITPDQLCGDLPKGFNPKKHYSTKPMEKFSHFYPTERVQSSISAERKRWRFYPRRDTTAGCDFADDRENGIASLQVDTYYPRRRFGCFPAPETDFDAYGCIDKIKRLAALAPQGKNSY